MRIFCISVGKGKNIASGTKESSNTTIYEPRSIDLDDKIYKIRKLLAGSEAVSLSALVRLMINEAYEQFPEIMSVGC